MRKILIILILLAAVSELVDAQRRIFRPRRPASVAVDGACDVTSDGTDSDTSALVDAASDGDIVCIPAGTFEWSLGVNIPNKNVYIRGAGIDVTTIEQTTIDGLAFQATMSTEASGGWRIAHMTITGAAGTRGITPNSIALDDVPDGRWRIDHIKFNFPAVSATGVNILGVNFGVIDHVTWNWFAGFPVKTAGQLSSETCSDTTNFTDAVGDLMGQQPLGYGTDTFVVVEDSTITSNGAAVPAYDSSSGGGRLVWRYNTISGSFIYAHWTRNCDRGTHVTEIYRNTFIGNSDWGDDEGYAIRIEAGTGDIHDNYFDGFTGSPFVFLDDRRALGDPPGCVTNGSACSDVPFLACNGARAIDGNIEANGWPCLDQIGRAPGKALSDLVAGDQQASQPFYLWRNGKTSGCATGGSCTDVVAVFAEPSSHVKATAHSNGDVDFVLNGDTPRPGHSDLAYPHRLQSVTWP